MLQIENLTKIYPNGTRALDNLSLEVPKGQFVAVIGLSGSGKSTLLRCINRLVEPTSGRILLDGIEVTEARDLRSIRRRIGMIFQHFNLVKRATVLTNVLSGRLGYTSPISSMFHIFGAQDTADARACLARVGLSEKESQRADALSGGQQQRVGIARALMQKPDLILADEPVASLDPATAHSVLDHLEQMNKQDGMTVLCNLHFLSLARRYADRVIALKAGRIVFDGLPEEIDDARFKQIYGEEAVQVEIA
ncbi:MAG: phosphonate ABC transporter ATP-binding protein [Armatimonadota bacterium]|nr:phosphonate ABC transporter ATP-binding protein [bacterium]